ncbi:sensor histidine kinase [Glutamicibacter uratoxydans]|uniref:sensor histidine kinase n=1 Tax=Glutamicibacter uratoxydans TaxID=43667 RepID=UPI003D6EC7AB
MTFLRELMHRTIPALPPAEWERPAPPPQGYRRDLFAALGFMVFAVLMQELVQSLTEIEQTPAREVAYGATIAIVLPLAFRRRYPILMMLISSAVFMIAGNSGAAVVAMQLCFQLGYFLSIYSAVAWARNRRALRLALSMMLLAMAAWLLLSFFTADLLEINNLNIVDAPAGFIDPAQALPIYVFLMNLLYFGGAIFLGLTGWSKAYSNELVIDQARRIAEQTEELAARAVTEERLRIARELHDVVAHHISAVGVQASAARLVQQRDPAKAAELMHGIENSARQAVGETRALLGVLREEPTAADGTADTVRHPEPSLAQLDQLVEQQAALGLQVSLLVAEHRPDFLAALPQGLSLALYRISSEALTNVRTHSTARQARLALRSGCDEQGSWVEVEVTDDGRAVLGSGGSGFGLRGIRERAKLHRGEVEIGPRTERGWRTRARLRISTEANTKIEL